MSIDNGYVSADYLRQAAGRLAGIKALSHERMAITVGDTVLDAGCGPGMDTVPLAGLVGSHGRVIAVDNDPAMLEAAEKHAQEQGVAARISHHHASVLALPFADGAVGSCRAERLFQVLPPSSEQPLLHELLRVTRSGGRVVLVDTDWGSASVDFADTELERRLMLFFATRMRPNGLAGRRLFPLGRAVGLQEISVDTVPLTHYRFAETPFGDWLIDTALQAQVIDKVEAARWRDELGHRDSEGSFIATVNMTVVAGRRP